MPWLRTHRPGARDAERGGAPAPWRGGCTPACTGPEVARARARPGLPGRGRAQAPRNGIPPTYPAILCGHGHGWPTAAASAYGTATGLPNSVPVFSDRWYCNEKSVMHTYIPPTFPQYSAIAVSARPPHSPTAILRDQLGAPGAPPRGT